MPNAIKNLTSRHIFIPINSGGHLRLSPGAVSEDLTMLSCRTTQKSISCAPRER